MVMKRKGFGEGDVFEHVPGAEVLDLVEPEVSEPPVRAGKRKRGDDEDEDDSGMEVDDEEEVRSIKIQRIFCLLKSLPTHQIFFVCSQASVKKSFC